MDRPSVPSEVLAVLETTCARRLGADEWLLVRPEMTVHLPFVVESSATGIATVILDLKDGRLAG